MLEQLKKYWVKVGEHPFLKHLFIIVCVLLVLGVATHLLLLLGTRHSAHRTVPDLTGIPLEEALGEARRKRASGSNPDERSMSRSTPTGRRW